MTSPWTADGPPLPAEAAERLTALLDGAPEMALTADLDARRRYGPRFVGLRVDRLAVWEPGEDGDVSALAALDEVLSEGAFGCGRLVAVGPDDRRRTLAWYTQAVGPGFDVLARVATQRAKGEPGPLPDEALEPAYCPSCGRALAERGARCTKCVARWTVFRRMLGLLWPYRGQAALAMALTFVTVGSQLAPPYLTKLIVDRVIVPRDPALLGWLIGAMVGVSALLMVARVASGTLTSWLGTRLVADLREQVHAHLVHMPLAYHDRHESGQLIARVTHDTGELQQFMVEGLPFLTVNALSLVSIAAILIGLDLQLALMLFVPVPFLVFGGPWLWWRLVPYFYRHGSRIGGLHSALGETLSGIKLVKAYNQEAERRRQFDRASQDLRAARFQIDRSWLGFSEGMFLVMSIGVAGVWLFAARRLAAGEPGLSLGDLLAFVGYIWLFYGPLQWFSIILQWMTRAASCAERIFAVLDGKQELRQATDAVTLPRIEGRITLEDVRFGYVRGTDVVKGIDLEIAPGEMIGLVGKSGAGKSTLINLVCRFYEVGGGQLSVDGVPIGKLDLTQLRQSIGIVPQDPFLFAASILDNLRVARPDASFADVVTAAKAAHAHAFILAKPDGYDTRLGDKGDGLSGGEKQRLAIARAILHDPPILILDEATSAVDSETEQKIQQATAALIAGRTTIAIAHRLATLRHADRLVVIEDGQIAEQGTHDELLAADGVYANLVKIQTELSALRSEAEVWRE